VKKTLLFLAQACSKEILQRNLSAQFNTLIAQVVTYIRFPVFFLSASRMKRKEPNSTFTQGHINWILAIAWSPDGGSLVSGDKAGHLICWDPQSGQQRGKTMTGHKQWITCLAWEPLHLATGGVSR